MSGLCGLVRFDGAPVRRTDVAPMTRAMHRRGPDAAAQWSDGVAALGHTMLRTTPEAETEHQPLHDPRHDLAIVFDGRIDDRDRLRADLTARGHAPREDTDPELVLQAFACWGDEAPQHLLGAFAFAVWDGRTRTLFLARDAFGERPLHYHLGDGFVAFASELRALMASGVVPRRMDEERLADSFVEPLECLDVENTLVQDVRRLPAGHRLLVRDGQGAPRRWWHPDPSAVLRLRTDADYEEGLRDHLNRAVRRCLRASPPATSMLSGGLDSAAIVATARDRAAVHGPLSTVSLRHDDPAACPEGRFIQAVHDGGGLDPHVVQLADLARFQPALETFVGETDDPFVLGILDVIWTMHAAAGAAGARVVLDGADGDLVLSRDARALPAALLARGRVAEAWRHAHSAARYASTPAPWLFLRTAVAPAVRKALHLPPGLLRRGAPIDADRMVRSTCIARDLADRTHLADRVRQVFGEVWGPRPGASDRERQAALFQSPFLPVALERYDRSAAAASVDHRHPLLDRELATFALSLPARQIDRDGWPKGLLRRALSAQLPRDVRYRPAGPNLSPAVRLAYTDLALPFLRATLRSAADHGAKVIDTARVDRVLQRYLARPGWADATRLWTAVLALHTLRTVLE